MEQHFLTSPARLAALAAAAAPRPHERVLELGAGAGTVAAALPPCRRVLVELDPALAAALRRRFPDAEVLERDALTVLEDRPFDVLLSNLPHAYSQAVLDALPGRTFRVALVAVRAGQSLTRPTGLRIGSLGRLEGSDFDPPQPFASELLRVEPRLLD